MRYSKFFKFIYLTGDLFVLNLSYVIAHLIKFQTIDRLLVDETYQLLWFNINLFWLLISSLGHIYEFNRAFKFEKIFNDLLKTLIFLIMMVSMFIVIVKGYHYSREHLIIFFVIFVILISVFRYTSLQYLKHIRYVGYNFRNVIIIGADASGYQFMDLINRNPHYGFKFMGFFDDRPNKYVNKDFILGDLDDAKEFAVKEKVHEIYCALPLSEAEKINDLWSFCDNNLIRFKVLPDFRGFWNKKVNIDFYDFLPVMSIRKEPLDNVLNRVIKRSFDTVFSFLAFLLIFSWLFPIIALLIKVTSKGPVFFKQDRSGFQNETFTCWKFRTMYVNEDANEKQATRDDPRITPIGNILRKTNLDELPQFLNVLMGNMSIVGPRPHMLKHTEEYAVIIDQFMVRHFVKPGITGWAQVKGFRGETKNPILMEKRILSDLWYIENWDFFLDLKIIFLTIVNMIKGEKNAF